MRTRAETTRPDKNAKSAVARTSPDAKTHQPDPLTGRSEPASSFQQARQDPRSLTPHDVDHLQRTVGNRAVGLLLAARDGAAPRLIQPKFTVGAANDAYEREADLVAARVMRMPSPAAATPAVPTTPVVHRAATPTEEDEVQTKSVTATDSFEVGGNFESRLTSARGGGQPLPTDLRADLEPKFGADFSAVRVHTGPESADLNQQVQAKAFTNGTDIHFGAGYFDPGSRAGQELLAHELTHTIQQTGGVQRALQIQRRADPTNAPDVLKVIQEGTANFGVYILNNGNDSVAIKFSKEDTRRAAFADKVLGAAQIGNTNARVASAGDVATIIANIRSIAERYKATGTDQQKAIAAEIERNIGNASHAVSVLIMDEAGGRDFSVVLDDPIADKSFLDTPEFHHRLGKLVAADVLLGNSDRLSTLASKPRTVKKKGKDDQVIPGAEWGVLNPKNFKLTANGIINTLDNDTEIVGLKLLRRLGTITTLENWATFLIGGGLEHVTPGKEQDTERQTPNLESLFDAGKRKLMFDQLVEEAKFRNVAAHFTVTFDAFDASFSAGIREALTAILQQMDALRAAAATVGGADAGGGYIDPDALEHKGRYLGERLSGVTADDAKSRMIFRMKAKDMLRFKTEFVSVPTVYLEDAGLTKFGRALTPNNSVDKFAESLKDRARKGGLDAATLKQDELTLVQMDKAKRGMKDTEPDRRVFKALFESKRARLVLYLHESDTDLKALHGGQPSPQWKKNWLREINFRATLDSAYRLGLDMWIIKLQKLGDTKEIAELQGYHQSMVNTAAAMQQEG